MTKILAIPGSLRLNSSSNYILSAILSVAPKDIVCEIYQGIGSLPHFNDPEETPGSVVEFRQKIREADAVLICTPEYAFGIPGSLKNALDWTVGTGDFVDKPVGLVTASSQGEKGHAAMLLVLTAIAARVIDESTLLIPFVKAKLDRNGIVKDNSLLEELATVVRALERACSMKYNGL
jgi:chromate reductase, NAD(P)H dehydrogenase (quinone)